MEDNNNIPTTITPEIIVTTGDTDLITQQPMVPQVSNVHALKARLQEMREEQEIVREIMKSMMVEGVHYGILGLDPNDPEYDKKKGRNKPALYQKGAEKIYNFFGYYPKATLERDADIQFPHRAYTAHVQITNSTGKIKGEGDGYASTLEPKFLYRNALPECPSCGKDLRVDKKTGGYYCWKQTGGCEAQFAKNDPSVKPGGKVEIANPSEIFHAVMSRASKRAEVRATIRAWALGDLFDEDPRGEIEGEPPQLSPQPPPTSAAPSTSTATPTPPVKHISDGQIKRLFAIARQKNISADEVSEYIHIIWKIPHINEIPMGTKYYDAIIAQIENGTVAEWVKGRSK